MKILKKLKQLFKISVSDSIMNNINTGVEVRKSSISGRGVFSKRDYKVGEKVIELNADILHADDVDWKSLGSKGYNYLQIGDFEYIAPIEPKLRFLNHSCDPNLGLKYNNGKVKFVAIKPIKTNQEVNFDYSTNMIEEEDEDSDDQAEEYIDQAIQDLEKLYRHKIKQMGGFPKLK